MNTVFIFKLLIFQYRFSSIVNLTCHDLKNNKKEKAKICNKRMITKYLFSAVNLLEFLKMNMK